MSTIDASKDPDPCDPVNGSLKAEVGHAFITMVEPRPGHEREYNRWYEDDHFLPGAMFAGRRWVATNDLKRLRLATDPTGVGQRIDRGSYLGTYWIAPGRLGDFRRWTAAANARLTSENRDFSERDHVFTAYHDRLHTIYRDDDVPREIYSLMDPSPGLVFETVDAAEMRSLGRLESWLADDHLPARLAAGVPASSVMVFRPHGPDAYTQPGRREQLASATNHGLRLTILWFLTRDPRECWQRHFTGEMDLVAASGYGKAALIAPFIPSKMGTSAYDDDVRPAGRAHLGVTPLPGPITLTGE